MRKVAIQKGKNNSFILYELVDVFKLFPRRLMNGKLGWPKWCRSLAFFDANDKCIGYTVEYYKEEPKICEGTTTYYREYK